MIPDATTITVNESSDEGTSSSRQSQSYDSFFRDHKEGLSLTDKLLALYKKKVLAHREGVAKTLKDHGSESFFDYTRQYMRENRNKIIVSRREELLTVVHKTVKRTLGSAIADDVIRQLKQNSSIATSPHYAPFSHPFVINPILQNALPYFQSKNNPALQKIIIFACANVSFHNFAFPPGHLFHSMANSELLVHPLRFFGNSVEAKPVLFQPAYDYAAITALKNKIALLKRDAQVIPQHAQMIEQLLEEVYASPHALSFDMYTDQITVTNYWFFKKIFAQYKKFVPDLIFISQEEIVLQLLKTYHLQRETILHQILFNPKSEALLYKYLEGNEGTFNRKEAYGTYLFWARKDGKYREQLWKKGNSLATKDGSFSVELTPEAIAKAIENNTLIPSVFLVYTTLALYYGLTLGGGPAQTKVLPKIKESYVSILREFGDTKDIDACQDILADFTLMSRSSLAFLDTPKGRVPATGLDLYLYGQHPDAIARVLESTKQVTLDEVANRWLPYFYHEFVSSSEKLDEFSKITGHDIEEVTGLDKKIPAWASMQ